MATISQTLPASPRPWRWLRDFLQDELRSRPGRAAMTARMVLATTLVMILVMTFRIPYGAYGAIYALTISRESPEATVAAVRTIIVAFVIGLAAILLGAVLFVGNPMLRLLWVFGILFTTFYAMSAMTNYAAAVRFGYLVVITIPLWDRQIPAELRVEGTLWAAAAVGLGSLITVLLELVFARLEPGDDIVRPIAERLVAVEALLGCYVAERPVDRHTAEEITLLATRGTSRLRRNLRRSSFSTGYREQMGALIALVGRLVDLAANLTALSMEIPEDARQRLRTLAENIARLRAGLLARKTPHPMEFGGDVPASAPLLGEMEKTVSLIADVLEGSPSLTFRASALPPDESKWRFFVSDALTNPDHIKFGLRGCLAAGLCYIIYTGVNRPEISTSVTTCLLTGLTTIGASRQKQVLRIGGALVGGLVGIGAQMFILPSIDSIFGFTLLFVPIMIGASWIATSSPRLSYFGVQVATAFDLINLLEFKMQTSLAVARDRILGIMLGLVVMWLVFDQLWAAPATVQMRKTFISTLRLLVQLSGEPRAKEQTAAIERTYSLRETIDANFDRVRALADGVLFEFGPSRQQDLALRDRIRGWQPQLRSIFLTRIALLKYCLRLPGFELPEAVRLAQREFDNDVAGALEGMANRIEGNVPGGREKAVAGVSPADLETSFKRLEQTTVTCCPELPKGALTAQLQTFLPLSRRIERLTSALDKEI